MKRIYIENGITRGEVFAQDIDDNFNEIVSGLTSINVVLEEHGNNISGLTETVSGLEAQIQALSGMTGITQPITILTYSELVDLINIGSLIQGTYYLISDFETRHFILDGNGNEIQVGTDAPAPENITITPNAVGNNLVDKYFKVCYLQEGGRSVYSNEIMVTTGDDTTSLIFVADINNNQLPDPSTTSIAVLTGTTSEVYDMVIYIPPLVSNIDLINGDVFITTPESVFGTPVYLSNIHVDFNVGEVEPLLVFATSTNTLDKEAKSLLYPQDIIHYDWNISNWTNDYSFYSNSVGFVEGLKGVIYFRHDTLQDNYMGYDFRNVVFRRWEATLEEWTPNDPAPLYVENIYGLSNGYSAFDRVLYSNYIYISLVNNNINDINDTNYWSPIYDLSYNSYICPIPTFLGNNNLHKKTIVYKGSVNYPDIAYADFNTFSGDYSKCRNNHFEPTKDDSIRGWSNNTILQNNVFIIIDNNNNVVSFNKIGNSFYCNTITTSSFIENNIGNGFSFNIISDYFDNNVINDWFSYNLTNMYFRYNEISNNCSYNNFSINNEKNKIGADFNYNILSQYFNDNVILNGAVNNIFGNNFYENNIGQYFSNNKIGIESYYNNFGNDWYGNTFGDYIQGNIIGSNYQYNIIGTYFNYNKVGNYNQYNTFGQNAYSNIVGDNVSYNTIGDDFYENKVGNDFNNNNIIFNTFYTTFCDGISNLNNFIPELNIYGNKNYFGNSSGNLCVSYYDDINTLIILNVNASFNSPSPTPTESVLTFTVATDGGIYFNSTLVYSQQYDTIAVDWGDGSDIETFTANSKKKGGWAVFPSHYYASAGTFYGTIILPIYSSGSDLANLKYGELPKNFSSSLNDAIYLRVDCQDLTEINFPSLQSLEYLEVTNSKLTDLYVDNLINLKYLYCNDNQLVNLDISQNPQLNTVYCNNNQLTSLDVSNNPLLITVACYNNQLTVESVNQMLDNLISFNNTNGQYFDSQFQNPEISPDNNKLLALSNIWSTVLPTPIPPVNITFTVTTDGNINFDSTISTELPNENFIVDWGDGTIENLVNDGNKKGNWATFPSHTYVDAGTYYGTMTIPNSGEILIYISCNDLSELNLPELPSLRYFRVEGGKLTNLSISNLIGLTDVYVGNTLISALDTSSNTLLTYLDVSNNINLTSLDLTNNTALTNLYCNNNQLTSLDISNNTNLTTLDSSSNQLSTLDIINNNNLTQLYCSNNYLTVESVDLMLDNLISFNQIGIYFDCQNQTPEITPNNDKLIALDAIWETVLPAPIPTPTLDLTFTVTTEGGVNFDGTIAYATQNDNFVIDWGDGTIENLVNDSKKKGGWAIFPSHTYVSGGTYYGTMTIPAEDALYLYLTCQDMTELNIPDLPMLPSLDIESTSITNLDVSKLTGLTYLNVAYNLLTNLDVTNNPLLTTLACYNNQLTKETVDTILDTLIAFNLNGDYFDCQNQDPAIVPDNDKLIALTNIWANVYPAPIPINLFSLTTTSTSNAWTPQIVTKTGANLYWEVSVSGTVVSNAYDNKPTFDFSGVGFEGEKVVTVTSIDNHLIELQIPSLDITELNVSGCTDLVNLGCYSNQLTSLDVSFNTGLTQLYIANNPLTSIDVTNNTNLGYLYCYDNQLTGLDLSNNFNLASLYCAGNPTTVLDVSNNLLLRTFYCSNNQLTDLDVTNNPALSELFCHDNSLTSLDVSFNTGLTFLGCNGNDLTNLDITGLTELFYLSCITNQLTDLDVSNNSKLNYLDCRENQISESSIDIVLDDLISFNLAGQSFDCRTQTPEIVPDNDKLIALANIWASVLPAPTLGDLVFLKTTSTGSTWTPQTVTKTGSILHWEVTLSGSSIYSVDENKPTFDFSGYEGEKEIVVSSINDHLTELQLDGLNITELNVNGCTDLTYLECWINQLTSLDVSNNTKLVHLYCDSNPLTSLDVSLNAELTYLNCQNIQLTSLDVSNNNNLSVIRCNNNQITNLDLSFNTELTQIICASNQLTNLDISNSSKLTQVYCGSNNLTKPVVDQILDDLISFNKAGDYFDCRYQDPAILPDNEKLIALDAIWTTVLPAPSNELLLTFNNITNAPVASASTVSQWNTFFNLPTNGTPFIKAIVNGNTVNLVGGRNLTLKDNLFANNYNLISIDDQIGCVKTANYMPFLNCTGLTTANLSGLTTAGQQCFEGCKSLTNPNFSSLTTAGINCFIYCSGLVNPDFSSLITAPQNCFYNCTGLVNPDFSSLTTTGDYCFYNCISLVNPDFSSLITAGTNSFRSCTGLTSPDFSSLTTADDYCFYMCTKLDTNFPNLITAGNYCFNNCSGLTNSDFSSLTRAGNYSFYLCTGLTTSNFSSLATGGTGCFQECRSLTTPDFSNFSSIGNICFYGCTGLTTPIFPDLTVLPSACFFGCVNLNIPFPSLVTAGGSCFSNCTILNQDFPNLVTGGDSSFAGCSGLTTPNFSSLTTAANSCFWNCNNLNTDFPALISAGTTCFYKCYALANPDFSSLITADQSCFAYCNNLVNPDFSSVTSLGSYCFNRCDNIENPIFNNLTSIGRNCFDYCYKLSNPDFSNLTDAPIECFKNCNRLVSDFPNLISGGSLSFAGCHWLSDQDFSKLTTAGTSCFTACVNLSSPDFSSLTTIGDQCFQYCHNLNTLALPSCTNLGTTVGDNLVFNDNTSGRTITLIVPSALMTCNAGQPDGDIQALINSDNVTINLIYEPELVLTFNNIINAPVANPASVSDWNTFFDLPTNGTEFIDVAISGNTVNLVGGRDLIAKSNLFLNNNNITSIVDNIGCVKTGNTNSFYQCKALTNINLSGLTTAANQCFESCTGLTTSDFTSLVTAGERCFYGCSGLTGTDFPNLTTAAQYCFYNCSGLTKSNFSSLVTAGAACFSYCRGFTNPNFSSLSTIGTTCFSYCDGFTDINLPSCNNLGTSNGNDSVFSNIIGKTITLTVPSNLMTKNGGNPDGDIQYLQTNNTVTVIQV